MQTRLLASLAAFAVVVGARSARAQTITDPAWSFDTSYAIGFDVWTASYNPNDGHLYVGGADITRLDLSDGTLTPLGAGSIGGGMDIDPDDGDIFYGDDVAGPVYRIAYGSWNSTLVDEVWIANFDSGDDDPIGLHVLPSTYNGPGDSSWGGKAVSVDRASLSPSDSAYVWNVDASVAGGMDWELGSGDISKIHDEEGADPPAAGGNMHDVRDVWGDENGIYIADNDADLVWMISGDLIDNNNPALGYQLVAVNATDFAGAPTGLAGDPMSGDLFVTTGNERVFRLNKTTGVHTQIGSGFSDLGRWGHIEISDAGDRMWIIDRGTDTVYQYSQVPEASTLALAVLGLSGAALCRRRSR